MSLSYAVDPENAGDISARVGITLRDVRSAMSDLTRLPPLSPDGPEWYGQMVSLPVPCENPESFQRRLYDAFRIEVPVQPWNGQPLIRVSIQAYNAHADVDRLVQALGVLISDAVVSP